MTQQQQQQQQQQYYDNSINKRNKENRQWTERRRRRTRGIDSDYTSSSLTTGGYYRQQQRQETIITMMIVLILALVAVQQIVVDMVPVVQGYPTGAGSCIGGGIPAIGGSHIRNSTSSSDTTTTTNFTDFVVTIGDTILEPSESESDSSSTSTTSANSNNNNTFDVNTTYVIAVQSANPDINIKGILIRLEAPIKNNDEDFYYVLEPYINTQYEDSCPLGWIDGVSSINSTNSSTPIIVGLTHTNNDSNKTIHSGTVAVVPITATTTIPTVYKNYTVRFDVTVVYQNNALFSIYNYHPYIVHFQDPNGITAPTTTTTVAPVTSSSPPPTTTTTTTTTVPTISPTITPTTTIVSDDDDVDRNISSAPLRKNPNNTLTIIMGDSSTTTTKHYMTIENIQVSLSYVLLQLVSTDDGEDGTTTTKTMAMWTDKEIRAYERITMSWYESFYNSNFYISMERTTNTTNNNHNGNSNNNPIVISVVENDTSSSSSSFSSTSSINGILLERNSYGDKDNNNYDDRRRTQQQLSSMSAESKNHLQSLYQNYGIIMGSMKTFINVTNIAYTPCMGEDDGNENHNNSSDGTSIKSNIIITYTQSIEYQTLDTIDNDTNNDEMKKRPSSPILQYITIPYRSKIGRQLYIESLLNSSLYTFSQLSIDTVNEIDESTVANGILPVVSVPILLGPDEEGINNNGNTTGTEDSNSSNSISVGYIVLIVCGGVLVVVGITGYSYHRSMEQKRARTAASIKYDDDDDDDNEEEEEKIIASRLNMINHDMETFRFSNTTAIGEYQQKQNELSSYGEEYHIYAPSGRLGIVLDDPTIVDQTGENSTGTKKSQQQLQGALISLIKENSPLIHETQMNVGDYVVAIDDIDVRGIKPTKISKLLNDRSKYPVRKITCIKNTNIITNTPNVTPRTSAKTTR